jgi:hypothetical protein
MMADRLGRYDHLSEKSRGYAEGVVAGFDAAKLQVEKLTGGALTLNAPKFVKEWDDVIRELRGNRPKRRPSDHTQEQS